MNDLQIARSVRLRPITDIAEKLGIAAQDIIPYGNFKAKIPLSYIKPNKTGKLVLVSALTPTPAGEGKTTTSIGLADAMNRLGKKTVVVLREPSLGPVFGVKGGATGGGYAQIAPMEDINLHFNGDFAAIEKAHNLLAALIDNALQHRTIEIDPRTIRFKRVIDLNDRALRKIMVGLGGQLQGVPREAGFDITAASEVMAILCLSASLSELQTRLGNILVGFNYQKQPVFARDLKAAGAMTALLKDAILPNLVQTLEATPALVHGGPFANIAQGTNTLIATQMAISLAEIAVTEAGFAFDLGGEKFLDIKCRQGNLSPACVVLVATIRALKYHGGISADNLKTSNPEALIKGFENLSKHIDNVKLFGLTPIVAINAFDTDTDEEIAALEKCCNDKAVRFSLATHWAAGGAGAIDLAQKVISVISDNPPAYTPLYATELSIQEKINLIATRIYGAKAVEYQAKALADLKLIDRLGQSHLPVCIAKTQQSLSDNPALRGAPKDFTVSVREIEIAAGAGFVVPIMGEIMRMPGLPQVPAAEMITVNDKGEIEGLF